MSKKYNADSISVLEGLDAVRKRPGMYIGSTGVRGLHHLLWEIVDNSIDEALAGYCNKIEVTLHKDGSMSVRDNGRGIPVDKHSTGVSTLEVVLTKLHAGGKFNNDNYKFSGGLHGVGISVVNALSKKTIVTVERDKKIHEQSFSKGNPLGDIKVIGDTTITGTTIRFYPDDSIFETIKFNPETISNRLRELSYLNKGITIIFRDEKLKTKEVFKSDNGLTDYIKDIAKNNIIRPIHLSYSTTLDNQPAEAEVVMTYVDSTYSNEVSFVNNIRTIDGGTHVNGFRTALTKIINDIAKSKGVLKDKDNNFSGNDIREGLVAIISIKLADPQFESQTKDKLGSVSAGPLVSDLLTEQLKDYLEKHNKDLSSILDKIKLLVKAKNAAKAARDMVLKKKNPLDSVLTTKLSNCSSRKPEECEIYLVEG